MQTRISKAPSKEQVLELASKLPQDAEGGGAPAELTLPQVQSKHMGKKRHKAEGERGFWVI